MAKRKTSRALTTAERIEQIETEITDKETELKKLKAQKKMLLAQKEQEDLKMLYQIIKESGKNFDEVKEILSIKETML